MRDVRSQPALPYTADIAGVVRRLGGSVSAGVVGGMMRGVDVTTSNVPGPPFPVFLAGTRVTDFFAFGPLAGSAINLTFFSYDGTAQIGISTDVAAVADPEAFVEDLTAAITNFAALG
ncbi:WS/DGAT domain-containing protein [Ilumatobacter sp.]|uniref:WS/DGAT domain-containing protein n=1 Tax=Ilumatobacter sp. TaxID=1967498 RepID=UPI003C5A25F8